jgi:Ca2+-binding EF-hand superfamily protein
MNPMEIDVTSEEEARLANTNQQISQDLIGICSIPLQGLLVNDLIQGEFPINNMKNQRVGKLIVNIIWEEIQVGINEGMLSSMNYKTDIINQDNLILKLANALKEKGLNVESAFNIFDIDRKNEISLDNFKNTLIFTLKFTTNQNEMEHLIKLLYTSQGKSKLDKADFYKIFSKLLPSGQIYQTQNNIPLNDTNRINQTQISKENQQNNINDINSMSTNRINQMTQSNVNDKDANETISSNTNRKFNEIGELIAKYKLKRGKSRSEAVDIFKDIFDRDASLGIDKKELAVGFEKIGIILTENELNNLWKYMSGNKGSIDFASFKKFHDKYCLVQVDSKDRTIRSDGV